MSAPRTARPYARFADFYPFYLSQHRNPTCRRLHVVGSALFLAVLAWALWQQAWAALLCLPVIGYGFAWVGHFFFEHNKPATFTHPVYSFIGDWVMFWQVLSRKLPW